MVAETFDDEGHQILRRIAPRRVALLLRVNICSSCPSGFLRAAPQLGTHTHTHKLSSPRSRKGCLRKRSTRSRRCVHNNTQRHNNTDAESHSPTLIHRISFTESHSPILIHRTEIRMSHAGCRGYIGRQEHPETQSNTRTYGTKKSSYVHAYIGRDGKWRQRVQT